MGIAGVDVGGTNIQVGLVEDGKVSESDKRATPTEDPSAVVAAIAASVESLGGAVEAVGVGIPGPIHNGRVTKAPNLEGWDGTVDLAGDLGDLLGVPIALGNDADMGLRGEWVGGAARGHADVLGVWIGTGVGGSLILGGRPHLGSLGAAGEIGHIVVVPGGALCGCGRRGCLEAYAGRRSMDGAIEAMAAAGRHTSLFDIQKAEGKRRPTSKVWGRALAEGDELASEVLESAVDALGSAIAGTVNLLDVELVVFGGGMAERMGGDLIEPVRRRAEPLMLSPNPDLAFVVAELGDDAGIIGAADLAAELLAR